MFAFDFLEQKLILCGNPLNGMQPRKNYSNAGVEVGRRGGEAGDSLGKKGKQIKKLIE